MCFPIFLHNYFLYLLNSVLGCITMCQNIKYIPRSIIEYFPRRQSNGKRYRCISQMFKSRESMIWTGSRNLNSSWLTVGFSRGPQQRLFTYFHHSVLIISFFHCYRSKNITTPLSFPHDKHHINIYSEYIGLSLFEKVLWGVLCNVYHYNPCDVLMDLSCVMSCLFLYDHNCYDTRH